MYIYLSIYLYIYIYVCVCVCKAICDNLLNILFAQMWYKVL